jgi:non-reducing end alpha-L-arabinofuranosidase
MRTRLVRRPIMALAISALASACADPGESDSNTDNLMTPTGTPSTPNGAAGGDTSGAGGDGAIPPGPVTGPPSNTTPPGTTPPGTTTPPNTPPPNTPPPINPTPGVGGTPNGGAGPSEVPTGPSGFAGTPSGGAGPAAGGMAGSTAGGGAPVGNGGTPSGGSGGGPTTARGEGPCDVYAAAGTPCVAAYSTVRAIFSEYDGPLYQVRSGSSAENTGSGGETHDIGMNAAGFADAAAQDAVCAGTLCTISLLYDQSGRGNHLPVAKRGRSDGGEFGDDDDFESIADEGPLTVGGHEVYSLFMDIRQGYRMTTRGDGVPRGTEPQGIYMLADGTHWGSACCWDFGNVTPDPTEYHTMNTLFFGTAFWGRGAGNGPWFMADYEAGVWAGGSNPSDPGWGSLDTNAPPNENNPSLPVPFALGFLKTDSDYALRMADLQAANSLTTAYEGPLPKAMDNQGAIVIGVGGDNSNNSWGTFFEGAVVAGYPSDEAEDGVMQNVKAAGYGQ